MKTFNQFLLENIIPFAGTTEKDFNPIFNAAEALKNQKIVWRGFNSKSSAPILVIGNASKTSFAGADSNEGKTGDLIKQIGIKNPAFGTTNLETAQFFGPPMVIIPTKNSTHWQNKNVNDAGHLDDSLTDEDIAKLAKGYNQSITSNSEIIFDTKEYFLVNPIPIIKLTRTDKFAKIKSITDLKTYEDAMNLVLDYKNWKTFNNKK